METRELIQQISSPLYDAKGWIKLIGILSIISGVLLIFSLVGIFICWLPIWMGLLLMAVASNIEKARQSGESEAMMESMKKLKTYFIINGVLVLISLIGLLISLLIAGGAIFTGLFSLNY